MNEMKLYEIKLNEIEWMKWNEMKLNELMKWNEIKFNEWNEMK